MSKSHAKIVVNPVSGSHSVRKEWPSITKRLRDAGLSFDFEFTRDAGHAIEIARRAADSGYDYLIAVGGDGTVNEVANGILSSHNARKTTLGIINAGTACSFAHSLGIPQEIAGSCALLTSQKTALIDVGVVKCWRQGLPVERFFVNEASAGFPAQIVDTWQWLPSRLGHTFKLAVRTVTGYSTLATHRNIRFRLGMDSELVSIRACGVVVTNGQYIADGMQIAPHASMTDGLLDVVIVGDVSKTDLLKLRPMLYAGSHIGHPKIRERKTTTIKVESDEQFLVETDGDILGKGPASFSILPSALAVLV